MPRMGPWLKTPTKQSFLVQKSQWRPYAFPQDGAPELVHSPSTPPPPDSKIPETFPKTKLRGSLGGPAV